MVRVRNRLELLSNSIANFCEARGVSDGVSLAERGGMTRSLRPRHVLFVVSLAAGAVVLAGCGDASVGSPQGLNYGHGGGGGTGSGGTSNGATGGGGGGGQTGGGGGQGGGGGGGAVDSGGGGGGGAVDSGAPAQVASYVVSVDKTALASDLLTESTLHVAIAPNGFSGAVTLSVVGLPTDVDVAFTNGTLTLDGSTSATTALKLTTHTSTKPGDAPFSIVATSSAGTQSTPATLTVNAAITIQIPSGVGGLGGTLANPYRTAYGAYPMMISAPAGISSTTPVTVRFYNADNVSHEIHASSPLAGFAHDPGSISPMSMDRLVRNVTVAGTYDFYLHDQGGPATVGRIIIQ
jgi:hypothetical protein